MPERTPLQAGLLGERLGHSYSKEIHEALGIYEYQLWERSPEELSAFAEETLRGPKSFLGCNVTIPYKKSILKYLDRVDPLAAAIGAVNTVYREAGSRALVGTNTDYAGFLYMLEQAGLSLAGKKVLILGSGGASAMVQYACRQQGAGSVTIASRHPETTGKADGEGPGAGAADPTETIRFCDYSHLPADSQILINTTPLGTYPEVTACPVDLDLLPGLEGVVDLIYNPLRTTLLLEAEDRGLPCVGGLAMLVAQATAAARLFLTGLPEDAPVSSESRAALSDPNLEARLLKELIAKKRNVVFIGMPGSGKSSLGKDIAKKSDLLFRDSDREILQRCGRRPSQIIQEEGESAFREIECAVIADLAKEHGQLIATGGGVVEREENLRALRRNGLIIYLTKRLEKLATKDRPLSKDPAALQALHARRAPRYEAWADYVVDNDRYYKKTLEYILRLLAR